MDDRDLLGIVMDVVGRETCLDDCAVLPCGDKMMVVTTDMLHQTTDFIPEMTDWQIGWMSAAVTLSDIAGMGAAPAYLLSAIGLEDWHPLEGIMRGIHDCCHRYGTTVIGGDLDRHGELTVVTTGIGLVSPENLVRRSGASPGDYLCITGIPGRAQAYLDGFTEFKRQLCEPQPRVEWGQILGKSGASSMMDDSDGIALSLFDLSVASGCGFEITSSQLPLIDSIPRDQALQLALYGGGDYELIFTLPEEKHPVGCGVEYTCIGRVVPGERIQIDGKPLKRQGFQHKWT